MGELGKLDLDRLSGDRGTLGRVIDENRPCPECGYNLKGLRFGGTCPECGTPITINRRKSVPDMGDSPIIYLRALSGGFQLMGAAGIAWIVWLIFGPWFAPNLFVLVATGGLVYAMWFGGLLLVLHERPFARMRRHERGGKPEWFALRLSILITQAFGFVVVGALAANIAAGGSIFWMIVQMGAFLAVMGGWPGLAIYLSRLAWWAGDDQLSTRLTALGFWLAALGAIWIFLAVMPTSIVTPLGKWIAIPILVLYAVLTVLLMIMVLRMSGTVRWAQINAINLRARDRRMAQRAKEETERARSARAAEVAAGGGTALTSDQEALLAEVERKHREMTAHEAEEAGAPPQGPMPGRQHVVESGDNVETFGLEDDDQPGPGHARHS